MARQRVHDGVDGKHTIDKLISRVYPKLSFKNRKNIANNSFIFVIKEKTEGAKYFQITRATISGAEKGEVNLNTLFTFCSAMKVLALFKLP